VARDWQSLFNSWARPPSNTEEEKAQRAERMIREAISTDPRLMIRRTSVYATGSYKNNTNTRLESDIDVAVVLNDCFYSKYPREGPPQKNDLGHGGGVDYGLKDFLADVGDALVTKFGHNSISRGSKAFDVHANTVRLDADVAVFINHRRYTGQINEDGSWHYLEGVEMRGEGNSRIVNWHDQHHENGVSKNNRTGRRYKRVARVLKKLRDDMKENGNLNAQEAADVPSFLLECIAYNASDACFQHDHIYDDVKAVITEIWNKTNPETEDLVLKEVSGLKWLFGAEQPWTKAQTHVFLLEAWHHVGFRR
jgi:hypothetical protein